MLSQYPGASAGARLVGKQNTAGQLGMVVAYTTGNGAYGSWAQVSGSTPSEYYVVGAAARGTSNGIQTYEHWIQIGVGASGSETVLGMSAATCVWGTSGTSYLAFYFPFVVPLRIPAGVRIAIRSNDASATAASVMSGQLLVVPYTSVEGN